MRKHCGLSQLGRVAVQVSGVCCLGALSHFGCAPGELSDGQQRAFRNELRDHYPEPAEDEATSDEMTEDEADEATADESDDETTDEATSDDEDDTADEVAVDEAATDEATTDETADEAAPDDTADDITDEIEAGAPAEPGISPCVQEVFQTGCTGSLCHYGGAINLPPDFEQDDLFTFLTSNGPACSDSARYVNLDDPMQSFIWLKVQGEQPTGCGTQMPPVGNPALSAEQLDCLEAWFASLEQ